VRTLKAGHLDKRVEIQANTPAANDIGEMVASWETVDTVWASIEPLTGREVLQAQQVQAESTVRIRIRYYSGLTAAHRLKYGSRIYEINSISDKFERGEHIELMCRETD
jgi:SPP1 family predicted phage head-tail adaptor